MSELRELTEAGIEEFRLRLDAAKSAGSYEPIFTLQADQHFTKAVPGGVLLEKRPFSTKFEFGRYIQDKLYQKVSMRELRKARGIWCWLTIFCFDEVCPVQSDGRRKLLRLEKYVPSATNIQQGLEKHLLYFPWKMVALHGDDARWFLDAPLREDTKVVRELGQSYRRNVDSNFLRLAKRVFFDDVKQSVKRGATTGGSKTPGTFRRLGEVTNQLDLTFDVFGMATDEITKLLPKEFHKWLENKPKTKSKRSSSTASQ